MVSLNNMLSCVTNPIKPRKLLIHILYVSPINTDCTFVHIIKRVSKLAILFFRFRTVPPVQWFVLFLTWKVFKT
jgi:hypothetical protein